MLTCEVTYRWLTCWRTSAAVWCLAPSSFHRSSACWASRFQHPSLSHSLKRLRAVSWVAWARCPLIPSWAWWCQARLSSNWRMNWNWIPSLAEQWLVAGIYSLVDSEEAIDASMIHFEKSRDFGEAGLKGCLSCLVLHCWGWVAAEDLSHPSRYLMEEALTADS